MSERSTSVSGPVYEFGGWVYQSDLRLLHRPDRQLRLKPLLDRLLQHLLNAPGVMLGRERLLNEVWTRRLVNDEVLSRAIAELRGLLGDDAREPVFIETLSKSGYRWIAPVPVVAQAPGPAMALESHSSARTPGETVSSMEAVAATQDLVPADLRVTSPAQAPRRWWHWGALGLLTVLGSGLLWWLLTPTIPKDGIGLDLLSARPLTADTRLEFDPRFDAAGRVVYVRNADSAEGMSELVMTDRGGQNERVLWSVPESLRHPTPAPDLAEIAVILRHGVHCEIFSVSTVDGRASRLTECATVGGTGAMEWDEQGAALLFTARADQAGRAPGLARLNRRSGQVQHLTHPPSSEGAHVDPRLSPDSRVLVYASSRNQERQLWWSDWPALRQRRTLLARPEPLYGHAFARDGRSLWVAGDLSLYRALHLLTPGELPQLLGGRGARSVDVAADGAAVWTDANYDSNVWVRNHNSGQWTAVARSTRSESQAAFSPDGLQLALTSNRGGSESVLLVNLQDGKVRALLLDAQHRWVRPSWASDGKSLILTAYLGQRTSLYRYHLEGDLLTRIDHLEENAFHGVELRDRLLFRAGPEPHSQLRQLQRGQTRSEILLAGPVQGYRASSQWLVWWAPGNQALQAAPLQDPTAGREVTQVDLQDSEAITLVENRLYYAAAGQLWVLTLPDGKPELLPSERLPSIQGPSLAISPAGDLAVSTLDQVGMDLMIVTPPVQSR